MSVNSHLSQPSKDPRRLSLRQILILISMAALLLPLVGIFWLRIYESALIRQTESELIAQAALISSVYKNTLQDRLEERGIPIETYGIPLSRPAPNNMKEAKSDSLRPILPRLDLAKDTLYPPRPTPKPSTSPVEATAATVAGDLLPVLQDAQQITLSGMKVLDPQGVVVVGAEEQGLSFAHAEEVKHAQTGQFISLLRKRNITHPNAPLGSISRNSALNVYVAMPIVLQDRLVGVVWLNRTPTDLTQALYAKRTELLGMALLLLGAALAMAVLTSFTITGPIQRLVQKTRLIAQGNPEGQLPLEQPVSQEMAELSQSIAAMAKTLNQRTAFLRHFTRHVSHALKTPLTSLQGSLELLGDDAGNMSAGQRTRFIRNMREDVERMKQMIYRLLDLGRADTPEAVREPAELSETLQALATQDLAINVQYETQTRPQDLPWIAMGRESLMAVLETLLENSQQHGADRVTLTVGPLNENTGTLWVTFLDNGPGVSEGNREHLFTPFFTTREAAGGTGLGLTIAQAILTQHGGSIEYRPTPSGACFWLELPTVRQ
jgi:signal transduction histidine kinase